jgi:hypothetical protein
MLSYLMGFMARISLNTYKIGAALIFSLDSSGWIRA